MIMKFYEDEDFITKQLYDANAEDINKLLKRYFVVKSQQKGS